jgi:tetratricopeptide (TPR) repeat protein
MIFRPARLRGSIHKFGDQVRLLATLELSGGRKFRSSSCFLWEALETESAPERLPEIVEGLAYRIYLDLTAEDFFKSWEAFRAYTMGLSHYLLWMDLQRSADTEQAEKHYQQALLLEPNNPVVQYNLALLKYFRFRQADNEQAIKLFRAALNAPQTRLKAHAHGGLASALLSEFHRFNIREPQLVTDAVYHGRMAIGLDEELDGAHKAYAYACHQLSDVYADAAKPDRRNQEKNRELAIMHYRKACQLNPRHYIAHNNLGNLYLEWAQRTKEDAARRDLFARAIRECEAALRINPAYVFAHDNLANAHYGLGELSKAAASYRDALEYKPDYPEAKNDYAMLHLEPGFDEHDLERAFALHRDALNDVPGSESQRRKLCKQFSARLKTKARAEELAAYTDPLRLRESLAKLNCGCLNPAQAPATSPAPAASSVAK